eukprot:COSAG02_NODE_4653_length_5132_cov_2.022651_8_plen_61_part_00
MHPSLVFEKSSVGPEVGQPENHKRPSDSRTHTHRLTREQREREKRNTTDDPMTGGVGITQ